MSDFFDFETLRCVCFTPYLLMRHLCPFEFLQVSSKAANASCNLTYVRTTLPTFGDTSKP